MAFDLNTLAGEKSTVAVHFMGQTAKVTYNPAMMTASNHTKAVSGTDEAFAEVFTGIVTDWDVKKGGRKVPLTVAGLSEVPLPFIRAVYKALMNDSDDGGEEGKASSAS